jgi:hypothetical protein
MTVPKRLTIEFEDGSKKAIEFSKLTRPAWLELSRMGLCSSPSAISEPSKNYILLRWKNGWREVIGIDKNSVELLRYYVLERVEEIGRIALEVEADYPVLFAVKRLPKELDSLVIFGKTGVKRYHMEPKVKREEGDKIEHLRYDRAERHFQPEPQETADIHFQEMMDSLEANLNKKGLSVEKLLTMDDAQKLTKFEELAKAMGLRGTEKQEDVYGFIQLIMEKLMAPTKGRPR